MLVEYIAFCVHFLEFTLFQLAIFFYSRAQCEVNADDIISVKAYYDNCTERWLVDNKQGFLIKYPDTLVTGTGIVGSLFCARRSVLSNLFAGSDPPNMSMVIGSLVHELLQEVR